MSNKWGSALVAVATAMLAVLSLMFGILHPSLNYDAIPYAALAKQARGAAGKDEAFRELAAMVGAERFQAYVSGPYRERMYRDDDYFGVNRQLYTIRPFYIAVCSAVGWLIGSDIVATYLVSAVATALAVALSYVLAGMLGLAGLWRVAVPVTWIAAGGLNLASLSTPDALEALLTLLLVWTWMRGLWSGARTAWPALIAVLMVATRTDAVVLILLLACAAAVLQPHRRSATIAVGFAALLGFLVVEHVSGNYGYLADLNFQLIEDRAHPIVPNLTLNLAGYLHALGRGFLQILGADFQSALYAVFTAILLLAATRERHATASELADRGGQRRLVLCVGLAGYLIVRFVLFPAPWARYVTADYVLAGMLLARSLMPVSATAAQATSMPALRAPVAAESPHELG